MVNILLIGLLLSITPQTNLHAAGLSTSAHTAKKNTRAPQKKTKKVNQPAIRTIKHEREFHALMKDARQHGHTILLRFYAPWCTACSQEETLIVKQLTMLDTKTMVIAINVENPDTALLVETFYIEKVPTVMVIHGWEGALTAPAWQRKLKPYTRTSPSRSTNTTTGAKPKVTPPSKAT